MRISTLSSTQRYAAAALLGLALRQAQIDQVRVLACHCERIQSPKEEPKNDGGNEDCSHFWTDKSHGLLRSVFHFLEIDSKAWPGLEKTVASSPAKDHAATFLRMISEEDNESSLKKLDVLTKSVDTMAMRLATASPSSELTMEKKHESQNISSDEMIHKISDDTLRLNENSGTTNNMVLLKEGAACSQSNSLCSQKSIEGGVSVNYQRKVTLLFELLSACVADTPEANNESSPLKKGYDARHRTALRLLATWLDIRWIKMEAMEIMVACAAIAVPEEGVPSDESESENDTWSKWKRGGIIGAAALTGGALMAITGGLAAPAIAAGVSALAPTLGSLVPVIGASGFTAVASAAGSAAGSVAVAASFGAAGAGLSGSKMAKRIGNVEEFEFRNVGQNNQGRLAVAILISGFVLEEEDFIRPWERTNDNLERFALVWESKNLFSLSTAIEDWLKSKLTLELMKQGAMMTVLSGLVTALAWPTALLSAIDFIDSKWSIAIDRSDKAGILLAEVLTNNLQGNRPVTLMGFSLGARIIFKCLQQLAELGDNEGLVEKVVLLGAPISSKGEEWKIARKMVSGRFVNVFSENDWILGVTFRASLLEQGLAGIQNVDVPGIENVNASHLIDGHSSYLWATQLILKQLDLDSYDPVPLHIPEKPQEGGVHNQESGMQE